MKFDQTPCVFPLYGEITKLTEGHFVKTINTSGFSKMYKSVEKPDLGILNEYNTLFFYRQKKVKIIQNLQN